MKIGNIGFLKKLAVLLVFIIIIHTDSSAQSAYKEIRINENGCNYLVEIDTVLLSDTGKLYKLKRFSIRGLSKRTTKRLRKEMPIVWGCVFKGDSTSVEKFNSGFCMGKKWKLVAVRYEKDTQYKDYYLIRYAFVSVVRKRKAR